MAQDEPTNKPSAYHTMGQPAHEAPETSAGRLDSLGIDLGMPLPKGQTKAPIQKEPDHGLEVNIEDGKGTIKAVDSSKENEPVKLGADGKPLVADPAAEVATKEAVTKTPEELAAEAAASPVANLPEFDAAKPEAVEAYTKAFVSADGKSLNMANLTADWQKSATIDAKTGAISGTLSDGVYKFLESKGIDRATVKAVEAGQVAQLTLQRQEVFTMAGGQEKYMAAVEWARKGGYDAAAQANFNAALNTGGPARKDAIDLLVQRHTKANPPARQVSPTRTMADAASVQGGDQGGVKPYPNYAAYQADLRKARATNDQVLLDTSRARLKASPWHTGS